MTLNFLHLGSTIYWHLRIICLIKFLNERTLCFWIFSTCFKLKCLTQFWVLKFFQELLSMALVNVPALQFKSSAVFGISSKPFNFLPMQSRSKCNQTLTFLIYLHLLWLECFIFNCVHKVWKMHHACNTYIVIGNRFMLTGFLRRCRIYRTC